MLGRFSWTTWLSLLASIAGGFFYCRHFFADAPGMISYAGAGQCMLDGLPLQQCDPSFTYPPAFALTMIPLAYLPLIVRNAIWYSVTVGGLIACFVLSESLTRRLIGDDWPPPQLAWWRALTILVSLKFVFAGISNQSYDTIVVLLVLLGLNDLARARQTSGGVYLALATALKATPLVFLPYLLVKRRYLAAGVMAAAVILFSLMPDAVFGPSGALRGGDGYFLAWLRQVVEPALANKMTGNPHTFWYAVNPNNYSLRGLVGHFTSEVDPLRFKTTLYAIDGVYAAVIAILLLRTPRLPGAYALDGSLLLSSMRMLSPMTSQSHYVATILPFTVLAATMVRGDDRLRRVAGGVFAIVLVLTNCSSGDLVGRAVSGWANEYRLLTFGVLSVLIVLAALVTRAPAWAKTAPVPAGTEPRAADPSAPYNS